MNQSSTEIVQGHTPGPWTARVYTGHKPKSKDKGDWAGDIVGSDGTKVYYGPFSFHALPRSADANLIAAAPEMLAILQRLTNSRGGQESLTSVINDARDVIRKAGGLAPW